MNKIKTTLKAVKNSHQYVVPVGYCQLQTLLWFHSPMAYAAGVYGWSCDLYSLSHNVAICTGYRTTGNLDYPYDRIRAFEARASKISYSTPDYREQLDKLIDELIADIIAFAEANPN